MSHLKFIPYLHAITTSIKKFSCCNRTSRVLVEKKPENVQTVIDLKLHILSIKSSIALKNSHSHVVLWNMNNFINLGLCMQYRCTARTSFQLLKNPSGKFHVALWPYKNRVTSLCRILFIQGGINKKSLRPSITSFLLLLLLYY